MIRSLIHKRLDAEEQALGASLDYARHMLRASLGAFVKFSLFLPLSRHRRVLPRPAYHVARIVATRSLPSFPTRRRFATSANVRCGIGIAALLPRVRKGRASSRGRLSPVRASRSRHFPGRLEREAAAQPF